MMRGSPLPLICEPATARGSLFSDWATGLRASTGSKRGRSRGSAATWLMLVKRSMDVSRRSADLGQDGAIVAC
jgi:hypothetical protein